MRKPNTGHHHGNFLDISHMILIQVGGLNEHSACNSYLAIIYIGVGMPILLRQGKVNVSVKMFVDSGRQIAQLCLSG